MSEADKQTFDFAKRMQATHKRKLKYWNKIIKALEDNGKNTGVK